MRGIIFRSLALFCISCHPKSACFFWPLMVSFGRISSSPLKLLPLSCFSSCPLFICSPRNSFGLYPIFELLVNCLLLSIKFLRVTLFARIFQFLEMKVIASHIEYYKFKIFTIVFIIFIKTLD